MNSSAKDPTKGSTIASDSSQGGSESGTNSTFSSTSVDVGSTTRLDPSPLNPHGRWIWDRYLATVWRPDYDIEDSQILIHHFITPTMKSGTGCNVDGMTILIGEEHSSTPSGVAVQRLELHPFNWCDSA